LAMLAIMAITKPLSLHSNFPLLTHDFPTFVYIK